MWALRDMSRERVEISWVFVGALIAGRAGDCVVGLLTGQTDP
jgi:hypothetical protein